MRLTTEALRRAVSRKRKADAEGAEGERRKARHQSPVRPPTQPAPQLPPPPPVARDEETQEAVGTVDLTADSPGEGDVGPSTGAEAVTPAVGPSAETDLAGAEAPERPGAGWEAPAAVESEVPRARAPEGTEEASSSGALTVRGPAATLARGGDHAESSGSQAIPSRPSLMNQGKRAERLLKQACLPEFQAELCAQSAGAFFREAYSAQLWVTNSMAAMRTVLAKSDSALRSTRRALDEAVARAEDAVADAAQSRASAAEATAKLDAACVAWEADLEAARSRAAEGLYQARLATEQLEAANMAVRARDHQIEAFILLVKAAEARAAGAVDDARAAESLVAKEKANTAAAEAKARDLEEEVRSAKAQAARAVEEFRGSQAYEDEVADASADAFLSGFVDGRDKVGRLFGLSGLEGIAPDDAAEGSEAGGGPREAEGAPAEATPQGAEEGLPGPPLPAAEEVQPEPSSPVADAAGVEPAVRTPSAEAEDHP